MKIFWVFFLLTCSVANGQTVSTGNNSTWLTFKATGYSLTYPANWVIDTSKKMGIDLFIFSKLDSINDKFRENVNVLSSDTEGQHVSLDTFVKVSLKGIQDMATGYKILESKLYVLPGRTYHKIEFTMQQGTFNLHFVQYYFATDKKVYTITLTTEVSQFERYRETGARMLDSFRLEN
ncbi:hypothetical protein BH11BAC4_BH11BAC4_09330 [soil metagenome]